MIGKIGDFKEEKKNMILNREFSLLVYIRQLSIRSL